MDNRIGVGWGADRYLFTLLFRVALCPGSVEDSKVFVGCSQMGRRRESREIVALDTDVISVSLDRVVRAAVERILEI